MNIKTSLQSLVKEAASAHDDDRDKLASGAQATRLLTAAERETLHAAEAEGHRANAATLEKRHAEKRALIDKLRAQHDQALALAVRQSAALRRSVLAEAEGRAVDKTDMPKRVEDMGQLRAQMLAEGIAEYEGEAQALLDQRDAALAAADEASQAALAARADRLELALSEAVFGIADQLLEYVAAYRAAHHETPSLPDLRTLMASPGAENGALRTQMALWRFWR